jgi:hypothetical protein
MNFQNIGFAFFFGLFTYCVLTGSCSVAQAGLEIAVLLLQPP